MALFDDLIPGNEGATQQPPQQFHPVVDKIIGVESAGNPNARNPRSSAAGLGQFIDSTWQEFIQERHPQRLAANEDIFALKTDPNLSREATDWYAKKNESFLQSKGLPTDPGAVYLAHFAGPGGAEKVLRANPDASAREILGQDVVNANPFLANMSARDVQAWARQKMGGGEGTEQLAGGGLFDDLIPQEGGGGSSPQLRQGNLFDDLIPDAEGVAAPQQERAMGGDGLIDAAPAGEAGSGGTESPPVVADSEQPGLFESIAPNFLQQSMLQMRTRNVMTQVLAGAMDIPTASQHFAELVKEREAIPQNESYVEGAKAWARKTAGGAPEYEGVTGALRFAYDHPMYVAEAVGESSFQTAEGIGAGLAGAGIGSVGGPIGMGTGFAAGLGASSALTEGIAMFTETLSEAGVDITNEESLQGAFANPALMAKAKQKAQAKGLTVGAFDAITSFLGIRGAGKHLAEGFGKVVGSQAVKKSQAREAIEEGAASLFLLEGPGGMAGEAFGQMAADEPVDNIAVMMEGAGEVALGGPQVAIQTAMARGGREAPGATEDQIKKVFTAVTETPSYEEAEAQGRKWFGFVDQAYTTESAGDGTPAGRTQVYSDYTQAEQIMGQEDPRKGKLVAADENDVTATSADAVDQIADPKLTPTPRFTDPAREPEARRLWEEFVKTEAADRYYYAVKEGLRLTPTQPKAEFVGDTTASEILPKSELPMRADQYDLKVHSPSQGMLSIDSPFTLNTETLLKDGRFTVMPKSHALRRLKMHERKETLGAALFEVNDLQLQEILTNDGWAGLFNHLSRLPDEDLAQVFETRQMRMRPSLAWNNRFGGASANLEIRTKLDAPTAKAALETTHQALIPRGFDEGGPAVPPEDQDPHISTATAVAGWDIVPLNPRKPGSVDMYLGESVSDDYAKTMYAWQSVAEKVMKGLGIKKNLIVVAGNAFDTLAMGSKFGGGSWGDFAQATHRPGFAGFMIQLASGDVMLFVPERPIAGNLKTPDFIWSVAMHEFGHALSYWKMTELPVKHQGQIFAAYRRYMMTYRTGTHGTEKRRHQRVRGAMPNKAWTGNEADPYYLTFEEWFAEQTARWGTSSAQPVGVAARFFRRLGRMLIDTFRKFQNELGGKELGFKAEPVIQEWLDSAYRGEAGSWGAGAQQSFVEKTRAANTKHGVNAALQAESVKTHEVLDAHLNASNTPPNTPPANAGQHSPGAQRAQSDRFNWLMKWGLGFKQLAQENPHIRPLQLYAELMKMSRLEVNNIMADAEAILKQHVRRLRRVKTAGRSQADRLADFLFDMTEMNYRNPDEVRKNVRRNPTQQEFQRFARKHQLSQEAIEAYGEIRDFFAKVVIRGEEVAIAEARAVFHNNPDQLRIAIGQAQIMTQKLLAAPYFPMSRFGHWAVTVRTASGGVEVFETYETQKEQQKALKEAARRYPEAQGWSVTASTLPEEAQSFAGMPPWFLDKLQQMPETTQEQQEWLQLLRYQVSPARSFRKHLLPRRKIAGHSRDLERIFARYAFQHARHYGRIKYQRHLEEQIKALRSEFVQFEAGPHDVNKRTRMADFLEDHFKSVMNPGPDWHFLRSATSVWYLGFMVSSAALNMTQTVLMTFPQLGSRFGDLKASGALMKASGDLTNYYKRGSYEGQTQGHFKMLDFLIKRGDITESMAAELAGLASGNALDSYMGFSDVAHRGWLAFADKAMLLFKLVEQWNRRVTARAAYDLAMGDINNPAVQEVKNEFFLQYQRMTAEGFGSDSEILATLFAGKMIDSTQYDYSKEARPRFMRGRKGLLFAFYMFTQNTVFQLAHKENRGLFTRYALVMMFLAGPMGLMPDEAEDVLNFVARRFFGKPFDLRLEARKLVNDLTGNPKWTDGILHGTGRYSFGIPHLLESMGGPDVPEIDFSRLVELRNIAPLPLSKGLDMVDRGVNAEKAMSRFVQDTAGAGFGLPFQWMMAALDGELALTDLKRWERGMPRAAKKVSETWRRLYEGGERVGANNYIMEYDRNDPQDVAELVAGALGFTPTRQALQWDVSMAQREQAAFWKAQRQALLNSAFQARFYYRDGDSWKRAREDILDYNKRVPDPKLRITGDTLKKSFTTRKQRQRDFLHTDGPNVPARLGRDVSKEFPEVRRVSEQKLKKDGGL